MKIEQTTLKGVYLITPDVHEDSRGSFYETYNYKLYADAGLTAKFIQDDISVNKKCVLKGMHGDPGTTKLVQVFEGSVQAVILNCDENSEDFGKWESFILSAENKKQLYIPPMYGNGYYVLSEHAVYCYKQDTYYGDYKQFTYKYNDPRFGIKWMGEAGIISERDV
ncbi:dTDP-4-dehydrorhamnose 3,5-epimerase family protein [Treponema socranskii]|uniref:dTDP-4-dehydrorhamnose 3,5-epimerase family protein n=1 Tax=Treponema socranskii TaxID=53419 RepID=UPI003D8A871F